MITNLSINSYAKVIYEIRRQEQIHWFNGLKSAEGFIYSCTKAQQCNRDLIAHQERELEREKIRLQELMSPGWFWQRWQMRFESSYDRQRRHLDIADIQARIVEFEAGREETAIKFRDSEMELDAAIQERDRILAEHPEVSQMSYAKVQESFSTAALEEQHMRFVAGRMLAARMGLPESVGDLLIHLSPDRCDRVLQSSADLLVGHRRVVARQEALSLLAHVDADKREEILLLAAQIAREPSDFKLLEDKNGSIA